MSYEPEFIYTSIEEIRKKYKERSIKKESKAGEKEMKNSEFTIQMMMTNFYSVCLPMKETLML